MKIFGTITKELITRIVIITFIYSIISYVVIHKDRAVFDQSIAIPLLFVAFGVVILISILYCLRKYHVWNARNEPTVDTEKKRTDVPSS